MKADTLIFLLVFITLNLNFANHDSFCLSRKCPENVLKVSRKCHESVTKVSRKCHESVTKVSRKCHERALFGFFKMEFSTCFYYSKNLLSKSFLFILETEHLVKKSNISCSSVEVIGARYDVFNRSHVNRSLLLNVCAQTPVFIRPQKSVKIHEIFIKNIIIRYLLMQCLFSMPIIFLQRSHPNNLKQAGMKALNDVIEGHMSSVDYYNIRHFLTASLTFNTYCVSPHVSLSIIESLQPSKIYKNAERIITLCESQIDGGEGYVTINRIWKVWKFQNLKEIREECSLDISDKNNKMRFQRNSNHGQFCIKHMFYPHGYPASFFTNI
ncbi:hypothetical protein GQR58_012261 [Nymphon striatum]|nr:hypothetical protein GQR58_012261 [Nymphon striatum]